jgi:hypothetical protein
MSGAMYRTLLSQNIVNPKGDLLMDPRELDHGIGPLVSFVHGGKVRRSCDCFLGTVFFGLFLGLVSHCIFSACSSSSVPLLLFLFFCSSFCSSVFLAFSSLPVFAG